MFKDCVHFMSVRYASGLDALKKKMIDLQRYVRIPKKEKDMDSTSKLL